MVKEYDYNSIYPDTDHEKLKEDHELLKKFFYEIRNHSAEKSRLIDELEDKIEHYENTNKVMFRTLEKQVQYIEYIHDMIGVKI